MATLFKLTIVTPDGKKIVDEADILNAITTAGAVGILANHLPLVAILEISHLNYKKGNESYDFAISGGVLTVSNNEVTVLADSFETKEEIDIERATKARERAEGYLKSNDPNFDLKRADLALKRALNRLSL